MKVQKEVQELGYPAEQVNEEIAVRAITRLAKQNFDKETGGLFVEAVRKLMRYLTTLLKNIFNKQDLRLSELDPNMTLQQLSDLFSIAPNSFNLNEKITPTEKTKQVEELFDPMSLLRQTLC